MSDGAVAEPRAALMRARGYGRRSASWIAASASGAMSW